MLLRPDHEAARSARPDAIETYRLLCDARREHLVEVSEPLVRISQVQRFGGTLISVLGDRAEAHRDVLDNVTIARAEEVGAGLYATAVLGHEQFG